MVPYMIKSKWLGMVMDVILAPDIIKSKNKSGNIGESHLIRHPSKTPFRHPLRTASLAS